MYLFLHKGREGERGRETSMCGCLSCPLLGTWPTPQACALTGNWTGNPLVHSPCSIHWAIPARASEEFIALYNHNYSSNSCIEDFKCTKNGKIIIFTGLWAIYWATSVQGSISVIINEPILVPHFYSFFTFYFYTFYRQGKGGKKRRRETLIGCLLYLVTFWFVGQSPTHWATAVRTVPHYYN